MVRSPWWWCLYGYIIHLSMIWFWVVHDKISYDSWGYIVGVQIRFVVDSLVMHICCLHGDLHKDKKNSHLLYLMMSHSYVVVVIWIKIVYYSYDAGFLLFLAHIWMRIVGWIHGWLFKVALLEIWWWWVLTYMMIGCFVHMLIDADLPYWWYLVHANLGGYGVSHIW